MLTSRKDYPFGGRVSTIYTEGGLLDFHCMISTAKSGFFKKQSTRFLLVREGEREVIGVFEYENNISKEERLQYHDWLTNRLDWICKETGKMLPMALVQLFREAEREWGYGTIVPLP